MRLLKPDIYVERVVDLPAQYLQSRGLNGLLLDMDGTLKNFHDVEVATHVADWMSDLRKSGIQLCLLSNGRSKRIGQLAASLAVPFVAEALKPFPFGCRKAVQTLGLAKHEVAFAGDQLFADHLAGRLAGLFTILVRPTSLKEPWFTRLKRPLESVLTRRLTPAVFTCDDRKVVEPVSENAIK